MMFLDFPLTEQSGSKSKGRELHLLGGWRYPHAPTASEIITVFPGGLKSPWKSWDILKIRSELLALPPDYFFKYLKIYFIALK